MEEKNLQPSEENQEKQEDQGKENEKQSKELKETPNYRSAVEEMSDEDLEKLFEKAKSADSYIDALQRTKADYSNYQKRMEREKANLYRYASQDLLKKLVQVMDNFIRAIDSGEKDGVDKNFLEGICLVQKEFQKVLEDSGLQVIEALGKPFDPNFHEALRQQEDAEQPDMTVIEEYEKGYLYHDRVIRPTKVVVSRKPPEPKAEENSEDTKAEENSEG